MDTIKLSEVIGQEILELRFQYVPETEYGLQSFHAYLKLSSDTIIGIPELDDNEYLNLTQGNLDYFNKMFNTGQIVRDNLNSYFVGQKIIDFYFRYNNDELDFGESAFIKLANGYYLTEKNFGPMGLTNIDLQILDEVHFQKELKRLNSIGIDVRSFTKTKNAC